MVAGTSATTLSGVNVPKDISATAFLDVDESLLGRRWVGPSPEDLRLAEAIAQTTGLAEPTARVLATRGVLPEDAARYLEPRLRDLMPEPRGLKDLEKAVFAAKICSYAQGYQLLRAAAEEYNWDLNYGSIALMWRGGCIIRAQFLGSIKKAFDQQPDLANLLLDPYFKDVVAEAQSAWRNVVRTAIELGIPVPAIGTALNYYDSYRCERLPANLLQAQRDYFGAHTYERLDKERGEFFHTNWTGRGGTTAATTYDV